MTDPELLAKKLAFIETCVAELRRLARPEMIDTDIREERFVEHTLQIAIQAAQDVASHIVSDDVLEPDLPFESVVKNLERRGKIRILDQASRGESLQIAADCGPLMDPSDTKIVTSALDTARIDLFRNAVSPIFS